MRLSKKKEDKIPLSHGELLGKIAAYWINSTCLGSVIRFIKSRVFPCVQRGVEL